MEMLEWQWNSAAICLIMAKKKKKIAIIQILTRKIKATVRIISKILSEFQWAKADELAYFAYLDGYLSMMNRWT